MTFIYHDENWKCDYMSAFDAETPPIENSIKEFCCNVILNEGDCVKKNKRKKRREIKNEWKKNLERLEQLSKPKKIFYERFPMKSHGIPIEKLMPRICQLATPRFVTPKYQKPCEEPIILPGKIRDWTAHRQWLAERAKPKKDFNKCCEQLYAAVCRSPRLSRDGMRRIQCLAKPRTKSIHWSLRPRSTNFHRSATERICKLSQPRVRFDLQLECRPILKVSKSAMSYQPSEKIKSLALPKHEHFNRKRGFKSLKMCQKSKKCFCCYRSISCDNICLKDYEDRDLKTA